jgi:hypothetical protein
MRKSVPLEQAAALVRPGNTRRISRPELERVRLPRERLDVAKHKSKNHLYHPTCAAEQWPGSKYANQKPKIEGIPGVTERTISNQPFRAHARIVHNLSAKVRRSPGTNKATERHNKSAYKKNGADTGSKTERLQ